MATRNPNLRELDCRDESQKPDGKDFCPAGVAETKGHAGNEKDRNVFEIGSGAGWGSQVRRTKRQHDDDHGKQPSRSLKDPSQGYYPGLLNQSAPTVSLTR